MHPKSSRSDLSEDNVPEIFRLRPFKSLNLYEVTVEELQQYMSNGDMTSVEYVTYNLERVHAVSSPSDTTPRDDSSQRSSLRSPHHTR